MTSAEEFYRIAAEDMVRTAAQAMRSANEFLRLATQARLRAERESFKNVSAPRSAVLGGSAVVGGETPVGAVSAPPRGASVGVETPSPFAGSRDPGALPGALGSRSLRAVSG